MPRSSKNTAYQLSGAEEAPVVALVHGIGVNRHLWRDYAAALAPRYRVLSYDLLGHGESPRPNETLSLKLFARQLKELLDELAIDRCAILGFSLGGMINRRFAMDYPERVFALVIMNSPHGRDPQAQRRVEDRVARTAQGGPAATIRSSLERWFTPDFLKADDAAVKEVRQWILDNDPVSFTQSRQVLASGVAELIRPEPPLAVPALTITCENDSGSTPQMSYAISDEIAGAETFIVPGLQHLGLIERPALFIAPILAFLDRVAGRTQRGAEPNLPFRSER